MFHFRSGSIQLAIALAGSFLGSVCLTLESAAAGVTSSATLSAPHSNSTALSQPDPLTVTSPAAVSNTLPVAMKPEAEEQDNPSESDSDDENSAISLRTVTRIRSVNLTPI